MRTLPMTTIGNLEFSRLLCGTNMFFGYAHFSAARSNWLKRYFNFERIVEVLAASAEEGVNGTVSLPVEIIAEALAEVKRLTGVTMHWMATPGGRTLEELKEGIRLSAQLGAQVCMPHVSYTDNNLVVAEKRVNHAEEIFALIRELGMLTGWSTHRPETLVLTDEVGYDCDCYILPLNSIGFLCSVETDWVSRVIRNAKKPVVAIKPLAAGRLMPPTGLPFVYQNIKPTDTVCLGFLSPEEVAEDVQIVRSILMGEASEPKLQSTRSKAALQPPPAADE